MKNAEPPSGPERSVPYPVGTLLAGHRLLQVLGMGGLGAVYKAIHEFTERPVALKLLLPQYAGSGDARERAR